LIITGKEIEKFKKYIGFAHRDKKIKLNHYKPSKCVKTNMDIIPFGGVLLNDFIAEIKRIEPMSQGIKNRGVFGKSIIKHTSGLMACKYGTQNMSYEGLRRLWEIAKKKKLALPKVENCLNKNFFFDRLFSINYTEDLVDMYDIEVTGPDKSFISNGFICHNSQGLEYPFIILPFINQFGKKLLQRNLLYTAITRAKEKVIVIGHGSALQRAIENASVSQRNTKLGERIKACSLKQKNQSSQDLPSEIKNYPDVPLNKEQSLSKIIEYSPTVTTEE
jgi:superfamily I DNA/RNA helicase